MAFFHEKLLRSIIEAHTPPMRVVLTREKAVKARVHIAAKALFGESIAERGLYERALGFMAREFLRDRYVDVRTGERARSSKVKSVRVLAQEAANRIFSEDTDSTAIQRLRTDFRGKRKQVLLDHARYDDDVEDSIEHQVLQQISDLVRPYGLQMKL